jgi:hypothetical protein
MSNFEDQHMHNYFQMQMTVGCHASDAWADHQFSNVEISQKNQAFQFMVFTQFEVQGLHFVLVFVQVKGIINNNRQTLQNFKQKIQSSWDKAD